MNAGLELDPRIVTKSDVREKVEVTGVLAKVGVRKIVVATCVVGIAVLLDVEETWVLSLRVVARRIVEVGLIVVLPKADVPKRVVEGTCVVSAPVVGCKIVEVGLEVKVEIDLPVVESVNDAECRPGPSCSERSKPGLTLNLV